MIVLRFQDDGMMDHDTDGDGAINLSTSQRPSASTTPNGDTPYNQEQPTDQVREASNFPVNYKRNKKSRQNVFCSAGALVSRIKLSRLISNSIRIRRGKKQMFYGLAVATSASHAVLKCIYIN